MILLAAVGEAHHRGDVVLGALAALECGARLGELAILHQPLAVAKQCLGLRAGLTPGGNRPGGKRKDDPRCEREVRELRVPMPHDSPLTHVWYSVAVGVDRAVA